MVKRRSNPNFQEIVTKPVPVQRLALFGPPLLLEDEGAAAYNALLAHVYTAVKPVDILDEIFVNDFIYLQWELLRWRRLSTCLLRARGLEALQHFLHSALDYKLYAEDYLKDLIETLHENLPEDQTEDFVQQLVRRCACNETAAVNHVNAILASAGLSDDGILRRAKAIAAEKLAQRYGRHDPSAVKQVHELLDAVGRTMDDFMAAALAKELDFIERVDRLATTAETRRNNSLREIYRRRAALGEALRRSVQEIEDGEFEVIETMPAKGKSAA